VKTHSPDVPAPVAGLLLCLCISCPAPGLTIQFNYDYDTPGFFNPAVNPNAAQARATLENAGRNYEMFTDSLLPIVPGGGDTWTAGFTNPATGDGVFLPGLVVPADTMIVFVGARNLGSTVLGEGGPGNRSVSGTPDWVNTVLARGQAGALLDPRQDFGPWGGSITFGKDITWNYDLASGPAGGQNDFFSTCLHELAHVLGFGTTGSWTRLVQSGNHTFLGPASESLYGGPVPLYGDNAHWASGTQGLSGGQVQQAEMTPSITIGTRKRLTTLDLAGLVDLGWQMPVTGDANLDGAVDAADYVTLKRDFTGPPAATWTEGDFDFDGAVTWRDLSALAANFGSGLPAQPAQLPEPTTLALLAAGCLAILRRRKKGLSS